MSIKLTYFDAAGRAAAVRIALWKANIDFEDCRIDYAGLGALKGKWINKYTMDLHNGLHNTIP